ncbi:MAG: transposase [Acholeplasmatales bacterium]|nr:transposase [Acholeplasmatales bacterium]
MYTYKVMIHPNNKQFTRIRLTLNKCVECNNIVYDYLDSFIKNNEKIPSCSDVRKWFTIQKQIKDKETLEKRCNMTNKESRDKHLDTLFYDVSNDALKQEIKDTYNSFVRFFKKLSNYPIRKKFNSYKSSFYVDPFKIRFTDKKVRLEKISTSRKLNRQILNWVNLAEKDRIPVGISYYNPRVVIEGNERLYIVVSVDASNSPKNKITTTNNTIGIDLNIKSVVTSDEDYYKSVTKTKTYKKAVKKEKRAQRKLSRRYIKSKELNKSLKESKNYIKERKIKNKYTRRVTHLKDNYIDYIIKSIIDNKPKRVCIEDLDVNGMKKKKDKKAKQIRRCLQQNPFRKLLTKLTYRCERIGIMVVKADRYYSSSKLCSNCGNKKSDLKLSDRVYICPKCGLKIDRDYNAALNLKKYALAN